MAWGKTQNLVGPQGPTGPNGLDGTAGVYGAAGLDGAAGPQGPAGADSQVPGPQGEQGPQGPAGTPADTSAFVQKIGDTMTGKLIINTAGVSSSLETDQDIVINTNLFGSGGGGHYSNTAFGSVTLRDNCHPGTQTPDGGHWEGSDNTALGTEVLMRNVTGSSNSAIGKNALHFNISGHDNAAIGTYSLQSNVSGKQNTACGKGGLFSNVDGMNNASVGAYSMFDNISGNFNTAIGPECLKGNTAGNHNTAAGSGALSANTVGTGNTILSVNPLYVNSSGNHNTAIGIEAGRGGGDNPLGNTTGSNNTFIGVGAVGAAPDESNVITLGNGGISALRCQVQAITALSDARDKTNIYNIPAGLSFINALRPVAFKWNTRDGAKVGIPEFGFIAQELLEVQASTGITVPNLVSTVNPDKLEASAGTLLPVLVNAIQELTVMFKTLQTELSILKGA